MESTTRKYNVLIYPCSETGETPGSEVHMEVAGDFRAFYEEAMKWIGVFHESRSSEEKGAEAGFRVHDDEGKEDIHVRCNEAEIILSLLYCCKDHEVIVREICYQGNRYTDISDFRFSKGFVGNRDQYANISRTNIRLRTKKNGCDILVYLFGPEYIYNGDDEFRLVRYPFSHGMVEVNEKQMCYAGVYRYWCYEEEENPDSPENDRPKIYDYTDGVEVFLETDGKSITFSALMEGKLYKKIRRDEEKVVFYSALCEGALLSDSRYYILNEGGRRSFWEYRDTQDVVFEKNSDGEYRYMGDNREVAEKWPGKAFFPPQTPDLDSLMDSALLLCRSYLKVFCEKPSAQHSEESEADAGNEDKKIWAEFRKILGTIHGKYGLTAAEKSAHGLLTIADEVTPAEVLYAACQFFSLEKTELEKRLPTEKLRKEYEVVRTAVEDHLRLCADPDEVIFSELCEIFASDFYYINRVTIPWNMEDKLLPVPDEEVGTGAASEYAAIFSLVTCAGKILYNPDSSKYRIRDFLSIMKYYRTNRPGEASAKKEIDTVIALRKRLREGLRDKVKGQDMAVEKFVDGYIRYQLREKVPGKPAGLYLFAGPPGTGKTYLAETFVKLKDVTNEGYQYKRFDMSAYGGGSSDAVTGLVGFERTWKSAQPGQLTDFVKKNPKCVLLFDEIEKASPQVRFLFLSVLEGAVLTDKYYNEQISFEDAILLFTTNEGRDLYEDNRETNLTALSDSAVIDGLQASNFAPELISRFLSGTIVMFNHLDYFNMCSIFENSVNTAAAQICRNQADFHFDLEFNDRLPKLYLLSKGDRIDARFVSANAQKTVEDYFLEAVEFMGKRYPGRLKEIKRAYVSVEVTEKTRKYFEMTEKPRILLYAEGNAGVYVGDTVRLRSGFLPEKELNELGRMADCDRAERAEEGEKGSKKSFREFLQSCNWNSRSRADRYDAILIDLGRNPQDYKSAEGYKCLKAAVEARPNIPVIVVDRGAVEDRSPLLSLGVTDFLQGVPYEPRHTAKTDPADQIDSEGLALDRTELEAIFDRQHFVEMAKTLVREGKRLSCDTVYKYDKREPWKLEVRLINLHLKEAAEEDAESRRQNRKYLLAEKPQVRLTEIFGNELVRKAVKRCIDNIRNPEKYREAGAKLMTGILMYGASGMGKTMFAKAMAFEANAAFISAVGSDFLRGDGVIKMEEMFRTARRKRPCILFIDEFDAISKNRNGQITSVQETVLEKFLKEMGGLETDNDGIYVVAATNYALRELDPAVTRRFSAKIYVPYPTLDERQEFLLDLLERKNLKDRISKSAARTLSIMMCRKMRNYAEIKAFIEESIAEAVYKTGSAESVTEKFLFDRIHDETDGAVRREKDQNRYIAAAFHEAGHAALQYHFGMKIEYVTIVSRGYYGGYAMAEPKYDTGQDFLDQICICFAGRAAETLYMEYISKRNGRMGINVGAGSDLQKATGIAYEYVCRYGLGERIMVVPEAFASWRGEYPEAVLPESEKEAIWMSVKRILDQQWQEAIQRLRECWSEVQALAWSLIYMQELDGKKVEKVLKDKTPYVDESCFWDSDSDYMKVISDGIEAMIPLGYAVYPHYPYSQTGTQPGEENAAEQDEQPRQYFYAVKKAEKPLGIFRSLQDAFAAAYGQEANCRRFTSEKAAQEYLEMLELKVFRQGENRFCSFHADALAEMAELAASEKSDDTSVKDLIVLKENEVCLYQTEIDKAGRMHFTAVKREEIGRYQAEADKARIPLALYLMEEMAERFLKEHKNAYRVIRICDKALQDELLFYMDTMEQQSKRYRRNLGYKD